MMKSNDLHVKTTFVLKNGVNALEFSSRASLNAYYKRFLKVFPDVDLSNIAIYKVIVYQLEKPVINGK